MTLTALAEFCGLRAKPTQSKVRTDGDEARMAGRLQLRSGHDEADIENHRRPTDRDRAPLIRSASKHDFTSKAASARFLRFCTNVTIDYLLPNEAVARKRRRCHCTVCTAPCELFKSGKPSSILLCSLTTYTGRRRGGR